MFLFFAASSLGTWLDTTFQSFDMAVFRFFGNIQNSALTFIAKMFTALGDLWFAIPIAVICIILLFFKRSRKYGLALLLAMGIGLLLVNGIIKPLAGRIRPYNTLQHITEFFGWYQGAGLLSESDYCFPSGHTAFAAELAFAAFFCFLSDKKRKLSWLLPVAAVLVACSRVYLMVHYATDVICGLIIGILVGAFSYLIALRLTKLLERTSFVKKLDQKREHPEKTGFNPASFAVFLACLCAYAISFTALSGEGGHESLRCSYHGDYDCYNEVRESSKYQAADGNYYCKIHIKEAKAAEN